MAKFDTLSGLDIGSSQITCIIGRQNPETGSLELMGLSRVPCRGLRGGVVVNIEAASGAISKAVEEAEQQSGQTVSGLFLGVRGAHIETFNNRGAYNIARTDKEITPEDVLHVIENAKAVPISNDREIIHVIPQDFSLDRQRGVPNPVGMEGALLEVDVHIVTASSSHLNNLWRAVNQAGFSVTEQVYGLLSAGDVVVTPEEKELGSLLIDVGGQSVGLAVYSEGGIRYTKELPVGSDFITRDISYGLRTSLAKAQEIKERYGSTSQIVIESDEDISYVSVDGRTSREISKKNLFDIIQPRVEEIFGLVAEEIQLSGFSDVIVPGGVVLTGGGSRLSGIVPAAERILGVPTRAGLPQDVTGLGDISTDPSYSTAIGLLKARSYGEWIKSRRTARKATFGRKMREWVEDLF